MDDLSDLWHVPFVDGTGQFLFPTKKTGERWEIPAALEAGIDGDGKKIGIETDLANRPGQTASRRNRHPKHQAPRCLRLSPLGNANRG